MEEAKMTSLEEKIEELIKQVVENRRNIDATERKFQFASVVINCLVFMVIILAYQVVNLDDPLSWFLWRLTFGLIFAVDCWILFELYKIIYRRMNYEGVTRLKKFLSRF